MKSDSFRQTAAGLSLAVFTAGFLVLPLLHRHYDGECHGTYLSEAYSRCGIDTEDAPCSAVIIPFDKVEHGADADENPTGGGQEHCSICFLSLSALKTALSVIVLSTIVGSFAILISPACNPEQQLEASLHGCRAPPAYLCLFA